LVVDNSSATLKILTTKSRHPDLRNILETWSAEW